MMVSTLKLKAMTASRTMIPLDKVFSIPLGTVLSKKVVYAIAKSAYSMVPLYESNPSQLRGYIVLKELIDYREEGTEVKIEQFCTVRPAVTVDAGAHMLEMMNIFKKRRTKMVFVQQAGLVVGVLTLKQVFEHIVLKKFGDMDVHQTEMSGVK
jgi:metal transporter CNNM